MKSLLRDADRSTSNVPHVRKFDGRFPRQSLLAKRKSGRRIRRRLVAAELKITELAWSDQDGEVHVLRIKHDSGALRKY